MNPDSSAVWLTAWNFEPSILFGIALLHGSYLLFVGPLRTQFKGSQPVKTAQLTYFTLGILTLILALVSPIDYLSNVYWFSAHMLQHTLLTLIAPPLLLLGLPSWLFSPLEGHRTLLALLRAITNPFIAFFSFNFTFALWHVPAYYQLALAAPPIHLFEHATIFGTAVLTWMPILSPTPLLPRLSLPLQVLYFFFQSFVPTGLGAILSFAREPIYTFYADAPRLFGISVLADQVWAGLIMWTGGAAIFLLALTIVFFKWFGREGPLEGQQGLV